MSWLNCRFSCRLLTVYLSMLQASDLIQPDEGQMNLSGADLRARCDHAGGHIANLIHGCRARGEESSLSIVWSACRVSRRRVRAQQTTLTLCLGEVTWRPKVKRKMGHILWLRGRRQATRNIKTASCGRETPARGCAYWILEDQANRMIHRCKENTLKSCASFWCLQTGKQTGGQPSRNKKQRPACKESGLGCWLLWGLWGGGTHQRVNSRRFYTEAPSGDHCWEKSGIKEMTQSRVLITSHHNQAEAEIKRPFFSCWSQSAVSSQHRFMSSLLGTFIFKNPPIPCCLFPGSKWAEEKRK